MQNSVVTDPERLSLLIGEIYDTTLDPGRWPGALEQIARFMQAKTCVLASEEIGGGTGGFHYSWGDDPHYSGLFRTKYARINPAAVPVALSVKPGEVCSLSSVMPYDEFLRSRLFKEWAAPQDYGDVTTVVIEKSAQSFAHLAVAHYFRDSPVNEDARARMRLLAPHICRAVAISKVIELSKIENALLADTFDSLAAGVFLLRENGRIAHANKSGHALLKEASLLRSANGVLYATNEQARASLHRAFFEAAENDTGTRSGGIAIPLESRDGERHMAYILSLASGARRGMGGLYDAAIAMFVHKATLHRPTLIEAVATQFKLTPSEVRVLFAVIEVGGAPQVASTFGISLDTVKTHLKRVFAKTGTNRQVDLVKLVAEYMSPLI
jgi:DNA-binding CsgD family transcriptional regulator